MPIDWASAAAILRLAYPAALIRASRALQDMYLRKLFHDAATSRSMKGIYHGSLTFSVFLIFRSSRPAPLPLPIEIEFS